MNIETHVTPRDGSRSGAHLTVQDVTVQFGGLTALSDVGFEVRPGQVLGVIGPNGAGKTTLFNVVCGFTRPQTGHLTLDGRPFRPAPQRLVRAGVSRSLQGLGLFPGLSVLENIVAGAGGAARTGWWSGLLALPRTDRDERELHDRAAALIDELGLGAHAHAQPGTLPYAVSKRVALARALVSEPRLLLLDEPAGGLGHDEVLELGELIMSLPSRGAGCSVMLVEHHVDLVMQVCDELVVLDFGRVIATGTPAVVREDPAVAEAYLGAEVDV
ncbi:ATP-binding cassette domain-containing protein [Aeromicrobium sp. SMF47]|uniref:ABC transporter ATP-binding protein n=1 Tax=Aeromicrobium TaxID=2040 RepID=UPI00129E4DFF|nr:MULTISPECIES: ABC transporter ATP-binding protein [Aeromicrobium]MRJ75671.1 ATP-binding cassette domain-containing protein [Aeromicrobium yanjiei]MRK00016.1 ATP-binding cassette domain-containing protein [Aeromicrobium sp. S22]